MKSTAILILGAKTRGDLANILFDIGFEPLVRHDLHGALTRIRRERFAAIIIDREGIDVDALEFVLNVRDLDETTPIVVVGPPVDLYEDHVLATQPRIHLIDRRRLRSHIENVL